jgi:hypothetical protein
MPSVTGTLNGETMKLKTWIAAIGMGVGITGAVVQPVEAGTRGRSQSQSQSEYRYVPYGTQRWNRGVDTRDTQRRSQLRSRLMTVSTKVRDAENRGRINRNEANRLYRRMDNVRDLLRNERRISDNEYERWSNDLREIQRDFRDDRRDGRGGDDRHGEYRRDDRR